LTIIIIYMYQTDFICTYKLIEEEYKDDLYRFQLLQAFDLADWDAEIIHTICEELYESLIILPSFRNILEKAKETADIKEIYTPLLLNEHTTNANANTNAGAAGAGSAYAGAAYAGAAGAAGSAYAGSEEDTDNVVEHDHIEKIVFILLFKYEYFDLIHKCICEHLRDGMIKETTLEKLMNKL